MKEVFVAVLLASFADAPRGRCATCAPLADGGPTGE
jgi:hypothetical protein